MILTALCGHAHLDLPAYASYLAGDMVDRELTDEELSVALETIPGR